LTRHFLLTRKLTLSLQDFRFFSVPVSFILTTTFRGKLRSIYSTSPAFCRKSGSTFSRRSNFSWNPPEPRRMGIPPLRVKSVSPLFLQRATSETSCGVKVLYFPRRSRSSRARSEEHTSELQSRL